MTIQRSDFLALLGNPRPLVADGAMGTMLHKRGVAFEECFDQLNLTNPAAVAVTGTIGSVVLLASAYRVFGTVAPTVVLAAVAGVLLLTVLARTHRQALRERFDIEFLVRAMGLHGSIRLDFDVVRAETEVGRRLKDVQERIAAAWARSMRSRP